MKIKERTKKFIEENKTVLIGCGLGIVGGITIFIAGKKIGETSNCPIANYFDELQIMRYRHFCT